LVITKLGGVVGLGGGVLGKNSELGKNGGKNKK